jgi:hypothetical protein
MSSNNEFLAELPKPGSITTIETIEPDVLSSINDEYFAAWPELGSDAATESTVLVNSDLASSNGEIEIGSYTETDAE